MPRRINVGAIVGVSDQMLFVSGVLKPLIFQLEKENGRLKKLVAEQSLDIAILKEAAAGNF